MHEIKTNDTSLLKISDKIRTSLPQLPPNLSIYQLYVWVGWLYMENYIVLFINPISIMAA